MRTFDAAKRNGFAVPELVLRMSSLVADLSDVWPEVDDGLIESFMTMTGRRIAKQESSAEAVEDAIEKVSLGADAVSMLRILVGKNYWNTHKLPREAIQNKIVQMDDAVKECRKHDLIKEHGGGKAFSLNSSKRNIILGIVRPS